MTRVCASRYEVPTQKASKLVARSDTVMAGNVAATMTESIATITDIRHIMKMLSLNLKDFFGMGTFSSSSSPSFCGCSPTIVVIGCIVVEVGFDEFEDSRVAILKLQKRMGDKILDIIVV